MAKQNLPGNKKNWERTSATHQVESLLKDIKGKAGKMVRVQINSKTSIELPESLSQEERDARVANYIKLHNTKV